MILKLTSQNLEEIVKTSIKIIQKGGVIIFPTDTVYGLGANALDEKAVEKVFKIKSRSTQKPISILVSGLDMARKFAKINRIQERFLRNPKLTAVLETREQVFPAGITFKGKIGIRIPNYNFLNLLLQKINLPLTGTSANISGEPASTQIESVLDQFKDKKHQPDLVIDAGNLKKSKPSTVIDLTGKKPKLLRK